MAATQPKQPAHPAASNAAQNTGTTEFTFKGFLWWFGAYIVLVAVAYKWGKVAITFALLLIVEALLAHWSDYTKYFQPIK